MRIIYIINFVVLYTSISFAQVEIFTTPLSDRIANYTIDVRFDPEINMIKGKEIINWKNSSKDSVNELQLHLYWNAFRDKNSTLMKEIGSIPDGLEGNWGYCNIKKLYISKGEDLSKKIRFIQPDDTNSSDKTVISIILPEKIPPLVSVDVEIEFESKIPYLAERAGYIGNFYHFSQWFPKIGVYTKKGWNCHQYHMLSEFFADFGVYDITMTVPEQYIIGSSGILVDEKKLDNGLKKYSFHAEDIHDFAWSADIDFVEFNDEFDDVKIRFLCQPDHISMADRFIKAIKVTLDYFGKAYGKYPYPQVTCIDAPKWNAVMEYPTLFLTGNFSTNLKGDYFPDPFPETDLYSDLLTIHEFGHDWWFGMIANNEFEYAWIDEGFIEYASTKALEYGYDSDYLTFPDGRKQTLRENNRQAFLQNCKEGIIDKPSWHFKGWDDYYGNVYKKAYLMLLTFDNYYGEKTWGKVVKTFFQRWKFKHPQTQDFIDIFKEMHGTDFEDFLQTYLKTDDKLDFKIGNVSSNKLQIIREGKLFFPVEIKITFADGSELVKIWSDKKNDIIYDFSENGSIPVITKIEIDPRNIIEFELSKLNNIRILEF